MGVGTYIPLYRLYSAFNCVGGTVLHKVHWSKLLYLLIDLHLHLYLVCMQ